MNRFAIVLRTFTRGLSALLPGCRRASHLQAQALRRRLPVSQRLGLWLHLLVCKWCRRYGRRLRLLGETAPEHAERSGEASTGSLSAEARERIKRRLQGR